MFTFDQKAIEDAFFAAGFDDVMVADEVVARREIGEPWEVIVDKGGRVKATRVRSVDEPRSSTHSVHGHDARILFESSEQTTLMFQLEDVGELTALLTALDEITAPKPPAHKASAAAARSHDAAPSEEDIWDDEDAF
jgi:hypothetical protein